MKSRKLAITALLIAINVVLSSIIIIPLGPVKAAPVQHFVSRNFESLLLVFDAFLTYPF